jgi:hypothetical protein
VFAIEFFDTREYLKSMGLSSTQFHARQALLKRGLRSMIDQGKSLDLLFNHLIENVERQSDKMLVGIFLYDPEKNDLTVGAAPNLQPVYKQAVNGFRCGPDQPACGSAVFKKQRVIAVDVTTDPLWEKLRELAVSIGVRAVWSQPIISSDGNALGTVAFYHPAPKEPDTSDIMILEATAELAAGIIEAREEQARELIKTNAIGQPRHQCIVYGGPPSHQLTLFASLVKQKLSEGYRCLYLNSPAMVAGLRSSLSAIGVDVAREIAENRLILSSESSKDEFDISEMLGLLKEALDQSIKDGFKGLWASGDMTWELGKEKNFEKILEYEHRLEKLFIGNEMLQGICQYHKDSLPSSAVREGLMSHQYVFINETLSRANPYFVPSGKLEDCKVSDHQIDKSISELCQLRLTR